MTKKKKKILLLLVGLLLITLSSVFYYVYQKIYDPENLKRYFIAVLEKVIKTEAISPAVLDISLMTNTVVIKDWYILDLDGEKFFEVSQAVIRFQRLLFGPKISSIEIDRPRFFLRRGQEGKFNFLVFRDPTSSEGSKPTPTVDSKPANQIKDFLRTLRRFVSKTCVFEVKNACVFLLAPGLLKKPFMIQKIDIQISRGMKPRTSFFQKKIPYDLAISFYTDLLQDVKFTGTYDLDYGLTLESEKPLCTSVSEILSHLEFLPPPYKLEGNFCLSNLKFTGLSILSPPLLFQGTLEQTQGSFVWKEKALDITKIQSKLVFHRNQLQSTRASASFYQSVLTIHNAAVQSNGSLFVAFELQDLWIDQNLKRVLRAFCPFPIENQWTKLAPQGRIKSEGVLTYAPDKGLDWNITTRLTKGKAQYHKLNIDNVDFLVQIQKQGLSINRGEFQIQKMPFTIQPGARIQFSPFAITHRLIVSFKDLAFDKAFFHTFPELEEVWEILEPEGKATGTVMLMGDPLKNLPTAYVRCSHVTAKFIEVPYRVLVREAKLAFQQGYLSFQVHGQGLHSGALVKVEGKVYPQEKIGVAYEASFDVQNFPLDETGYKTFSEEKDPTSWLKDIQSIWDHLSPSGFAHIQGKVHRPLKVIEKTPDYDVLIQPANASVSYKEFPYPVSQATGKIKIKNGIVQLHQIKAKKGNGDVEIAGTITAKPNVGLGVDICVSGSNLPLDEDLKKALGPKYEEIWESLQPIGKMDLGVHVTKVAQDKEVEWKAGATLKEASILYTDFPYRIENLSGELKLTPGHFEFCKIRGNHDKADITLAGTIQDEDVSLQISARELPLEKELYEALPEEGKRVWDQFSIQGSVNLNVKLRKAKLQKMLWQAAVSFKNMKAMYRPFAYPLHNLEGRVQIAENGKILFACRQSEKPEIMIRGNLEGEKMNIQIAGKGIELDYKLAAALPAEYKKVWERFQPSGPVDMQIALQKKGLVEQSSVYIIPRHCTVQYEGFPYKISQLTVTQDTKEAGIYIRNGNIEFNHLVGIHGKTRLTMQGSFYPGEGQKKHNVLHLKIAAQNLFLDSDLQIAIAQFFPNLLKNTDPGGKIARATLEIDSYETAQNPYLRFSVKAEDLQAPMKKGYFLEKVGGNIQIAGYSYEGKYHAQGTIEEGEVTIKNIEMKKLSGQIKFFQDYLVFHSLRGTLYEGDLAGSVVLDVSPYGAYKCFLSINQTRLDQLSLSWQKEPNAKPTMAGSLSGELALEGNSSDTATMTGKGRFQLSNGELWQFPVFLALLDVFSLPSKPAFRRGDLQFSIFQKKIAIPSLRFDSSVISISGKGSVDFDSNLDLTLLTHFSSSILPRIPLVDKVWDNIRHDLFAIAVQGTLEKPKVSMKLWK